MLTGEIPYKDVDSSAIIWGVGNNSLQLPIPESCPDGFKILLRQCWWVIRGNWQLKKSKHSRRGRKWADPRSRSKGMPAKVFVSGLRTLSILHYIIHGQSFPSLLGTAGTVNLGTGLHFVRSFFTWTSHQLTCCPLHKRPTSNLRCGCFSYWDQEYLQRHSKTHKFNFTNKQTHACSDDGLPKKKRDLVPNSALARRSWLTENVLSSGWMARGGETALWEDQIWGYLYPPTRWGADQQTQRGAQVGFSFMISRLLSRASHYSCIQQMGVLLLC